MRSNQSVVLVQVANKDLRFAFVGHFNTACRRSQLARLDVTSRDGEQAGLKTTANGYFLSGINHYFRGEHSIKYYFEINLVN